MRNNIVERDRPQLTLKYGAGTLHAEYLRIQTRTHIM